MNTSDVLVKIHVKNGNFHLYSKHRFLSFEWDNLCICMYLNLLITFNDLSDAS